MWKFYLLKIQNLIQLNLCKSYCKVYYWKMWYQISQLGWRTKLCLLDKSIIMLCCSIYGGVCRYIHHDCALWLLDFWAFWAEVPTTLLFASRSSWNHANYMHAQRGDETLTFMYSSPQWTHNESPFCELILFKISNLKIYIFPN